MGRSHGVPVWLGVVLFLGCGAERQQAPPEPVARAVPEVERCDGVERSDRAELRRLLADGEYGELDDRFAALQSAYEADVRCESSLWAAHHALLSQNAERIAQLGAWVEARPESWAAHAARGHALVSRGYEERGRQFARKTPAENFQRMRASFAEAERNLRRAIELEPRYGPPYGRLMSIGRASGGQEEGLALLDAFLEIDPLSYRVRLQMVHALHPSWGGSVEAMEALANEAQVYADRNPELPILLGYPHAYRGAAARRKKDWQAAVSHYGRALAHGELADWRRWRGSARYEMGDYAGAEQDARAGLESQPDHLSLLVVRGRALIKLGRLDEALEGANHALAIAPRDRWFRSHRGWIHEKRGDFDRAIEDYRSALEIDPDSSWTVARLGWVLGYELGRWEEAEPVLRRSIELDPDDATAWFRTAEAQHALGLPAAAAAARRYLELADHADASNHGKLARADAMLRARESGAAPGRSSRLLPALSMVDAELAR